MKKLLAITLVLVMLLPVAALAEDIVGSWYLLYDKTVVPEFASNFNNCDLVISVYSFMPNGTIILTENDITDGNSEPHNGGAGKWEKSGNTYTYSIVGLGSGDAYVEDGILYIEIMNKVYLKLMHMEPFSPYTGYKY